MIRMKNEVMSWQLLQRAFCLAAHHSESSQRRNANRFPLQITTKMLWQDTSVAGLVLTCRHVLIKVTVQSNRNPSSDTSSTRLESTHNHTYVCYLGAISSVLICHHNSYALKWNETDNLSWFIDCNLSCNYDNRPPGGTEWSDCLWSQTICWAQCVAY